MQWRVLAWWKDPEWWRGSSEVERSSKVERSGAMERSGAVAANPMAAQKAGKASLVAATDRVPPRKIARRWREPWLLRRQVKCLLGQRLPGCHLG
jgi:hypothetical protein